MKNQPVSLGRRFMSYLLDWYLGALFTALPIALTSQKLYGTMLNQNLLDFKEPYGLIVGIVSFLFAIFYFVIVPAYINPGQTLGKRICHIKIVQQNNKDVTIKNILLRQLLGVIIVEGSLVSASAILHQIMTLCFNFNFVKPLMYVGIGVSILSTLFVAFTKNHQAIHDFIGKTKVVMVNSFPK